MIEQKAKQWLARGLAQAALDPDMPSLGHAAARLAGVDEDRQSLESLCEIALSDPALAQKIIRTASAAGLGGGRAWSLSRALMTLGMEQVRAMALALSMMEAAKRRKAETGPAKKALATGLMACFGAREAAAGLRLEKDGWGLRALFMGCLPFFVRWYAEELADAIDQRVEAERIDWGKALKELCGVSESELLERLMEAWRFPPEARRPVAGAEQQVAETAVRAARALQNSSGKKGSEDLIKALSRWEAPVRSAAQEGLVKGVSVAALCGMDPEGKLAQDAMRRLAKGEPIKRASLGWADGGDQEPSDESPKSEAESIEEAAPGRGRLPKIAGELASQAMEGATRADLALQGIEALAKAIGMERGLCAFGAGWQEARIKAVLGGREWARHFAQKRAEGKQDMFSRALQMGADACAHDASKLRAPLPEELSPMGSKSASFAFFALGPKTKPRGYAVFSSDRAREPFSKEELDELKSFCAQWAAAMSLTSD